MYLRLLLLVSSGCMLPFNSVGMLISAVVSVSQRLARRKKTALSREDRELKHQLTAFRLRAIKFHQPIHASICTRKLILYKQFFALCIQRVNTQSTIDLDRDGNLKSVRSQTFLCNGRSASFVACNFIHKLSTSAIQVR